MFKIHRVCSGNLQSPWLGYQQIDHDFPLLRQLITYHPENQSKKKTVAITKQIKGRSQTLSLTPPTNTFEHIPQKWACLMSQQKWRRDNDTSAIGSFFFTLLIRAVQWATAG